MYFSKSIHNNLKALSGVKSNTNLGLQPEGYLEEPVCKTHSAGRALLSSEAEDDLCLKSRSTLSLPLDSQRLTKNHCRESGTSILRNQGRMTSSLLSRS